ncbi:MAG: O-methyltransferase [Polyangiales bacterium]
MADAASRSGTTYARGEVVEWLNATHAPHDAALAHAFEAPAKHGMPAIMVNPSEAKLLQLLLTMIGARKVVEIGTLAGYSTIRLARALPADGHVWTCELDPRHAEVARASFAEAGLADRITVLVGGARETLASIEAQGPFDAVFVDADKESYDAYGRWAAAHVRKGGLLIGDNSFFFGELLGDKPGAIAMRRFHEEARQHFDTVNVPTPDGMLLGIRK